jgi:hypothetical protein
MLKNIVRISFNLIVVVQLLLVIMLYYFWINELLYVVSFSLSLSFRDPKELFLFADELSTGIFFSTLLAAISHFINGPIKNKIKMNRWLQVLSLVSTLLVIVNLINFIVFHPYSSRNPFAALAWLLD